MRLGHISLDSLRALAKQEVLEGELTCNLEFGECCVLDKGIVIHRSEDLLDCVHVDIWGPTKTTSL